MAYEINYNDKRFQQVNTEKQNAIKEVDKTYGEMIGNSDKFYQAQIDASKQWADKQTQLQNEQTDFAIQQIEQQKEQAQKDYTKEQSGAYVDWQKQSNQYGVNAEQMASSGMTNTGYSESSKVAMYTAYQNRVATARESYNQIVMNYNNKITEARLQNNSALAEIAYNSQKEQLELALQGFQYKNQLIIDKANKKTEVENNYYNRYQDVLAQINHENALAEEIRQYNEKMAEEKRQYNQTLALQKQQLEEEKRQYNSSQALKEKQLAEEIRQFNEQLALSKSKSSSSGSSSSSKNSSSSSSKSSSSGSSTVKKSSSSSSSSSTKKTSSEASAYEYLNKLIASGATKDKVSNEIALALRNGAITSAQATKLRNTFTPRGLTY